MTNRKKYAKIRTSPEKAKLHTEQLEKVLWYSAPIAYLNYELEANQITRAKEARKRKKNRANSYIRGMFRAYNQLYFVTLTFSPESLEKLKVRTRKTYCREWLEQNCRDFIANIDYGKKNHREHFHALCALNDTSTTEWKYGFSKVRKFKMPEDGNPAKISGYILKLVNHAGKVETGSLFTKKSGMKEVDELPF